MACEALLVYIEFSQLELQQTHINDIAGNARDLYSLTNSDSSLPNEEESAETGGDDVLHREQEPSAEKPKVGSDRLQVRSKDDQYYDRNGEKSEELVDHSYESLPIWILNTSLRQPARNVADCKKQTYDQHNHEKADC
jgi:hypothetical protein